MSIEIVSIALLSLGVIANAETLIGQEFSQLIYVFEFLLETHRSNPYIGELSEFSFERDFPRVTEERYSASRLSQVQSDLTPNKVS